MTAGDIAYWSGSKVETVSPSNWNTSLGTPVGVVVIPRGVLPDGKARIIGFQYCYRLWNTSITDTSLTNYAKVPITDNVGFTSNSSNTFGTLPSDYFDGTQSYVDPLAKYRVNDNFIPSPYLGNKLNPEYCKELNEGNMLSDFNGFTNTQTLVGLGNSYEIANECWNYKDGVSKLQWYLPAIGELGFLAVRVIAIQNSFKLLGIYYEPVGIIQSSTEYDSSQYCAMSQQISNPELVVSCDISYAPKQFLLGPAIPFAMIE